MPQTIDPIIPQMEPCFGAEEAALVNEYMTNPGFITEYKRTSEFEQKLCEFTGARHCIVVNNGTVSLMAIGMALGIGAGDEVIVPNYTMIASANAFAALGARIVFADVEPQTLCLDVDRAAACLTPRTKAIVLVNANGRSPQAGIDAFVALAARAGVALVEDAAQALGSYYPCGTHMGLRGLVGSLSFSAPKIISTGQGGALLTNDDAMAEKLRCIKDFGRSSGGQDYHPRFGLNFKFTELQACVGLAQMDKLRARMVRKKQIQQRYEAGLAKVPQVRLFSHDLQRITPWFVDTVVEGREELIAHLKAVGVNTRKMYPPLNQQPIYHQVGSFPVAEDIGANGLWLPSHSHLLDSQIDHVCRSIAEFYGRG